MHARVRRLIVLGSTGSIGVQTLEVVAHVNRLAEKGRSPIRFEVVGLAAGGRADSVLDQARRLGVRDVALANGAAPGASGVRLRAGPEGAEALVREVECDVVVAAIAGSAGLRATLAAVDLGRDIALANKETLVAAGALIVPAARSSGSRLLPVDSEHSGVWQCVSGLAPPGPEEHPARERCPAVPPMGIGADVERVVLTASGGPFRGWPADRIARATPAEALNHPTWRMGPKVTVDSASLMNKALEVIEAHWLFGLPADRIGVVIHPQSIVHAIVEVRGGSMLAQLAPPDMRVPIQLALTWPDLVGAPRARADLGTLGSLTFEPAEAARFPALGLAREAIAAGGTAGAILNGANEACVEAFLAGTIPFGRIVEAVGEVVRALPAGPVNGLPDVLRAAGEARELARERLAALAPARR